MGPALKHPAANTGRTLGPALKHPVVRSALGPALKHPAAEMVLPPSTGQKWEGEKDTIGGVVGRVILKAGCQEGEGKKSKAQASATRVLKYMFKRSRGDYAAVPTILTTQPPPRV